MSVTEIKINTTDKNKSHKSIYNMIKNKEIKLRVKKRIMSMIRTKKLRYRKAQKQKNGQQQKDHLTHSYIIQIGTKIKSL